MAELELGTEHMDVLAEMNEFNIEGRYPITYIAPPTQKEALDYMKKSKVVFEWLTRQL